MKQKILPINLINSFLILGLLITGGLSYAQNDVSVQEQSGDQAEEVHDTQNLDKLLKNYNQDQEKVLKDAEKMLPENDTDIELDEEMGTGQALDSGDEKSKDGKFHNLLKRMKADKKGAQVKYSEVMKVALEPLQKLSEQELMSLLSENTDKSSAGEYIRRYPKLAIFTIALVKDKNALPSFAKMADDQDKLIRFLGIMLATILIGMFLKRIMRKEGRPIWKAVSLWFLRLVTMTCLRFAILLFFFSEEITPIFKIAAKTFF